MPAIRLSRVWCFVWIAWLGAEWSSQAAYAQVRFDGFSTTAAWDVPPGPDSFIVGMIAADWNGDGRPDIALETSRPPAILVHLADGAGGLLPPIRTDLRGVFGGSRAFALDFNGDGFLDYLHADWQLMILRGLGNGRFGASFFKYGTFPYAGLGAFGVGDFDEDGFDDLIAFGEDGLQIVHGASDPSEVSISTIDSIPVDDTPRHVGTGDVNADGHLDVFFLGSVYLGDGGGEFVLAHNLDVANVGDSLFIHLDDDETMDLVTCIPASSPGWGRNISLWTGNGLGQFRLRHQYRAENGGRDPDFSLSPTDLDGDGSVDLVVEAKSLIGDIGGGYIRRDAFDPWKLTPRNLHCAIDLAGDGAPDIVYLHAADRLAILPVRPGVGMREPAVRNVSQVPIAARAGDMDGDGILDLVTGSLGNFKVSLGPLGRADTPQRFLQSSSIAGFDLGDFDEDGRLDIVASARDQSLIFLRGDGTGGVASTTAVPVGEVLGAVDSVDVDVDGHLDVVLVLPDRGEVVALLGDGLGGLRRAIRTPGLRQPGEFVSVDLNGDGLVDLAVLERASAELVVLVGDGRGRFTQQPHRWPTGDEPRAAAFGDLDGDGRIDLAVGTDAGQVILLRGDGTGGFAASATIETGDGAASVAIADFDGDGRDDLATANLGSYDIVVHLSPRTPVGDWGDLRPLPPFAVTSEPRGFVCLDHDEDGRSDLIVLSSSRGRAVTLTNLTGIPDWVDCRTGNVDAGRNAPRDVLFVNGSPGGGARKLSVPVSTPLTVDMATPPSAGGSASRFALYAWIEVPTIQSPVLLPQGIGDFCIPGPLSGERTRAHEIWNNIGLPRRLGVPTRSSTPAPSRPVDLPTGLAVPVDFWLQGLVLDIGSPSGILAVTNGIEVHVR